VIDRTKKPKQTNLYFKSKKSCF